MDTAAPGSRDRQVSGTSLPAPRRAEGRAGSTDAAGRPAAGRPIRSPRGWQRRYARQALAVDLTAVCASIGVALGVRHDAVGPFLTPAVIVLITILPVLWPAAMLAMRSYESRFTGVGNEEFDRVLRAATSVLAVVATVSWALDLDSTRGVAIVALSTATVLTLVGRYALRRHLHAVRRRGGATRSLLVAGHPAAALSLVREVSRATYHGYHVVGVLLPPAGRRRDDPDGGPAPDRAGSAEVEVLAELGVPVLGALDDVATVAAAVAADAVAVLTSPELGGVALRRIGWALEDTDAELLVAPSVTEVIGPRVSVQPVCGLPLLHLHRPELTGVRRVAKGAVDRILAASVLLLASPLLLGIAVAIRLGSPGPVLFRQQRIGRGGRPFTMLKFRSMVADAEARLQELATEAATGEPGNEVLFKLRSDPRVTRVGRVLRKYSLDEVPQLLNVVAGRMSLVGPRPPLPAEVATYPADVRRRLLVKPGLTGMWQVNGRSDLSWEESVRLDLRYVENWSFAFDFMIMWKTLGAVLAGRGAY